MEDRSRIRGLLFDNDGTLVDTHDLILESMRFATASVLGQAPDDEKLMANIGKPLVVQMKDFSPDPQVQEELLVVYREYNEARHDDRIRAFPGIRQCLEALRDHGLKLAVVTSKTHWLAWHGLELLGLAGFFDACIGSDDCTRFKPDPQPALLGAQGLALDPEECIFVGDSPFDMRCGKDAGMQTIAVTWGTFPKTSLQEQDPTFIVHEPSEIVGLLRDRCDS